VDQQRIVRANVHEFYSVVRAPDEKTSVLSRLKVVEPGYPFYGRVTLKSGRPFGQVLAPGACIVEQTLLDRTGLEVGGSIDGGYTTLTIQTWSPPNRIGPWICLPSDRVCLSTVQTWRHWA
jgi:predicted lysophospholipase L1 biosynthesis ABC-type transport system permease subunit